MFKTMRDAKCYVLSSKCGLQCIMYYYDNYHDIIISMIKETNNLTIIFTYSTGIVS